LLCALAWALRYPFAIIPCGDPEDPYHYTVKLGQPPSDSPTGDAHTRWADYETTVDALPGESVDAALARINGDD
jgi:hypothetical protein